MNITEKKEKPQELLGKVVQEAWNNESFKKELIANPNKAIKALTGENLPLKEGVQIHVSDQGEDNTFYLNLPKKIDLNNLELSEEQLEMASGGWIGSGILGPLIDKFWRAI